MGMYVEYLPVGGGSGLVLYIDPDPPPRPAGEAPHLESLQARNTAAGLLVFPVIAAMIGLAIGAADGLMCRLPRRMLLGGGIGLLAGFIGAFVTGFLANLVYAPLNQLALEQHRGDAVASLTTFGFIVQMTGRGLAWCLAGMAMGLGQGLALRSKRLLLYGFLGGLLGGLIGGLLFDPIDLILLGVDKPSAHWARLVGFVVIGATVGGMIGVVERLARDAWLRMVEGPLAGKEFLIFKDVLRLGSSPRSEIYLFNDPDVAPKHAVLRATGDIYEIENTCQVSPACVNGAPVQRARLHPGDRITLGRTAFVFQRQRGE